MQIPMEYLNILTLELQFFYELNFTRLSTMFICKTKTVGLSFSLITKGF